MILLPPSPEGEVEKADTSGIPPLLVAVCKPPTFPSLSRLTGMRLRHPFGVLVWVVLTTARPTAVSVCRQSPVAVNEHVYARARPLPEPSRAQRGRGLDALQFDTQKRSAVLWRAWSPVWPLSLRGGQDEDERKRKAAAADASEDKPGGKRPRLAERDQPGDLDCGADGGGRSGREKAIVRIPRDLIKKLRAVVKEIPEDGVAVAWFVGRYQALHEVNRSHSRAQAHLQVHAHHVCVGVGVGVGVSQVTHGHTPCMAQESLKAVASSLGFKKVTALLGALPAICNYTWPCSPAPNHGDVPSSGLESGATLKGGMMGMGRSNDSDESGGRTAAASRHQKRIYRLTPGALKAARTAAENLRQKHLWQQVCVPDGWQGFRGWARG